MFDWLRRRSAPPSPVAHKKPPTPARQPAADASSTLPPPLPEVVGEGNTQADWSAWEDSMTALDSQLQDLVPSRRIYLRDTQASLPDEEDPFASVRGKRDV